MDASWTISELCERVASALADAAEPPGGKARAVPDERAVRYYTTLGLLDRATLRGRTAYYGARHLAQQAQRFIVAHHLGRHARGARRLADADRAAGGRRAHAATS